MTDSVNIYESEFGAVNNSGYEYGYDPYNHFGFFIAEEWLQGKFNRLFSDEAKECPTQNSSRQ